jgi:hypothetical protein
MSTTSPPTESSNFFSLWLNNFETQAQNPTTAHSSIGFSWVEGLALLFGSTLSLHFNRFRPSQCEVLSDGNGYVSTDLARLGNRVPVNHSLHSVNWRLR